MRNIAATSPWYSADERASRNSKSENDTHARERRKRMEFLVELSLTVHCYVMRDVINTAPMKTYILHTHSVYNELNQGVLERVCSMYMYTQSLLI